MTLLRVENLRVAYPSQSSAEKPVWAVDGVSFKVEAGERLGFVGESGCGKSTLGRASMRLLPQETRIEGEVLFEGKSVFGLNASQLRRFRGEVVSLVFQDPMTRLDPLMTIGDHCVETLLAHQPQLSKQASKNKALETLDAVRIPRNRWSQYPHEFSGGMRQRVAIALALLLDPKLIVADEPTTSLDVTVASEILQELTRLCAERDLGLLLISHDLALVGEYCDRVAVMYQGKMVEFGDVKTILQRPQHDYTRSLLNAALHIQVIDETQKSLDSQPTQTPLLAVTDLKQHFALESNFLQQFFTRQEQPVIKAVDGVSFSLQAGEIFGLVGESGCGKSTLSRTILQLISPTSGSVKLDGTELTTLSTAEVRNLRQKMQMIFQDPLACLNPLMSIGEGIADPLYIHNLAKPGEARQRGSAMLEKVGLTPVKDYYHRYPRELSGGQQQRVAIARALITQPKLLICDEPVSMLDASIQSQVLDLMQALKTEFNLTYLFITHDLWVARFLCDRIAVMNAGKIVEMGETHQLFDDPQHPYTKKLLQAAPLLVTS
ncbi:ABC transporter ATP-binding protein [Spirulina sp. CS-785/01]|uniref:dipeptide ABC transporter ATP-binding protein n=1 Tax=Spirulina sp. CS-785/01 TaxID=3021716 RepID=UPI002330E066|nr:ABC transporter ATP-binding protein [Spirulina sp. CS-785/01]MDB9311722.1 ABC transporter ATP-binding protein [Spirulina sp. CS-785/01]